MILVISVFSIFICPKPRAYAQAIEISSPSAILMEASTGTIIYEKNADELVHPASVTKIMTLLLIFEALDEGKIKLSDEVTVSEYAASMGGSQVFLEPGEVQSVESLIKCIAVSSANDAAVAMSEYLCSTEEAFVDRMNDKAKKLGMTQTHFVNCNGLDEDEHLTTAQDVAIMSRELITKYPQVFQYSSIWMDTIIHRTKRGESEFGLANTNKLISQYQYATGLKTGSTSLAKFCVSATARQNGIDLIAVIMQGEDSKTRFADAISLLNYGFSICRLYEDRNEEEITPMKLLGGEKDFAAVKISEPFHYLAFRGEDIGKIEKKIVMANEVHAPVVEGNGAGEVLYYLNGAQIGSVPIIYMESVAKATFLHCFQKCLSLLAMQSI